MKQVAHLIKKNCPVLEKVGTKLGETRNRAIRQTSKEVSKRLQFGL